MCDSLDGPVVKAAQQALDTRNVSAVLIWVGASDVEAGRRLVKAYVEYIHYVEQLHEAIGANAHGHYDDKTPEAR